MSRLGVQAVVATSLIAAGIGGIFAAYAIFTAPSREPTIRVDVNNPISTASLNDVLLAGAGWKPHASLIVHDWAKLGIDQIGFRLYTGYTLTFGTAPSELRFPSTDGLVAASRCSMVTEPTPPLARGKVMGLSRES